MNKSSIHLTIDGYNFYLKILDKEMDKSSNDSHSHSMKIHWNIYCEENKESLFKNDTYTSIYILDVDNMYNTSREKSNIDLIVKEKLIHNVITECKKYILKDKDFRTLKSIDNAIDKMNLTDKDFVATML
jgi:hypothetical protein